jgi:hypothetical protein
MLSRHRLYGGVFLFALATLVYEISLIRILSFTIWYHFAYVVISTALLGFGAAGTLIAIRPKIGLERPDLTLGQASLIASATAVGFLGVMCALPFDPMLITTSQRSLAIMLVYEVAATVPFFFSGVIVSIALRSAATNVDRLYFWDLLGAGLGCAISVPMMDALGPPGAAILACAAFAGASANHAGTYSHGVIAFNATSSNVASCATTRKIAAQRSGHTTSQERATGNTRRRSTWCRTGSKSPSVTSARSLTRSFAVHWPSSALERRWMTALRRWGQRPRKQRLVNAGQICSTLLVIGAARAELARTDGVTRRKWVPAVRVVEYGCTRGIDAALVAEARASLHADSTDGIRAAPVGGESHAAGSACVRRGAILVTLAEGLAFQPRFRDPCRSTQRTNDALVVPQPVDRAISARTNPTGFYAHEGISGSDRWNRARHRTQRALLSVQALHGAHLVPWIGNRRRAAATAAHQGKRPQDARERATRPEQDSVQHSMGYAREEEGTSAECQNATVTVDPLPRPSSQGVTRTRA